MEFKTKILTDNQSDIKYAAELIKSDEIVGMPTETVYGLAADATNVDAVKKIFIAKGRPQDNPLIVHICDINDLGIYVHDIPDIAIKLAEKFWPGPLTMILPKNDIIPNETSAGLDTVGIRFPSHIVAQKLIRESGTALAAPSANLSGSPSPTTAMHVFDDMNGRIPAILDGGKCSVGVESTVISFENETIRVLRPGYISVEDFKKITPNVITDKGILNRVDNSEIIRSPGMKYKHYSPKANVIIVDADIDAFSSYIKNHMGDGVYGLVFDNDKEKCPFPCLTFGNSSEEHAKQIFDKLREFDKIGAKTVYAHSPRKDGVGLAVYNRLLRAAGFEVIVL